MKANAHAFCALNNNKVIDFKDSSKAKDVVYFVLKIHNESEYD